MYRLKAVVTKDPHAEHSKLHIRYFWQHGADELFQTKIFNNDAKPMPQNAPIWQPMPKGVTFSIEEVCKNQNIIGYSHTGLTKFFLHRSQTLLKTT